MRQSAFAKRRRLNDGTTTPTTDSDASASSKTTKKLKATKGVAAENVAKVAAADRTPHVRKTDIDIDDENTFEPLVVAEAVQFSGVREIEQVDGICKVRLSEGQVSLLE